MTSGEMSVFKYVTLSTPEISPLKSIVRNQSPNTRHQRGREGLCCTYQSTLLRSRVSRISEHPEKNRDIEKTRSVPGSMAALQSQAAEQIKVFKIHSGQFTSNWMQHDTTS